MRLSPKAGRGLGGPGPGTPIETAGDVDVQHFFYFGDNHPHYRLFFTADMADEDQSSLNSLDHKSALLALLLLVPAPTIAVIIAMIVIPGTVIGQAVFMASKVWIFLLPVIWHMRVDKQRPHIPWPTGKGMAAACITGSAIFAAIAIGYWGIALPFGLIDDAAIAIVSEKAKEVGLTSLTIYIGGAIYWCTVNSLLEEYVWRWFVFTRCEAIMPRFIAVVASGLFFTLHHVIALTVYFDWPVTVLCSLGVFTGGATWSWLYLRYRNIYAAYISHVFADVIIFYIGYLLIFQ